MKSFVAELAEEYRGLRQVIAISQRPARDPRVKAYILADLNNRIEMLERICTPPPSAWP